MGEDKCTTLALRYCFVTQTTTNGELRFEFKPEPLRVLEVPDEPEPDECFVDDVDFLRSLDPKEWKDQDHYAVLGLKELRFKASEEDIKRAYRRMVLKHHPDKRKALGEEIRTDDDYFTCITRAYEILGTPIKRRSYDSVDPEFDDAIPSGADLKEDFFELFPKYFELNVRWSEKRDAPLIGDESTIREQVEAFYSFWYNFESWREFSYLDEEEKEKGQDRDERRWIEKQNKVARVKRKKEEMARIRTLVDLAYNADPRIARFKQDEKDKKLAAKRAKQTAAQARKEEEERALKEMAIAKEKADAEERARLEAVRQERETQKRALKKERKLFRDQCKAHDYYCGSTDESLAHMTAVEKMCELFKLEELEKLNTDLKADGRNAFVQAMQETERRIEDERKAVLESKQKSEDKKSVVKSVVDWTPDHIQLLIKAVNLFPAGTNQRWEVIANFLNQHGNFDFDNSARFTAKDVLAKAKDLQNTDFSRNNLKTAANQQAYTNFEKDKRSVKIDSAEISTKLDEPVMNGKKSELAWTPSEQQLLEQALKTFSNATPDRWDRIAECLPNRTKKDCMRRYKELVEIVKAKKAAQAALLTK